MAHIPSKPAGVRQTRLGRALAASLTAFTLLIQINGIALAQLPDARVLFEQGRAAYAAGRYAEARDAWVQAYEASGHADLLYNVAQAYRGLGQPVRELDYLERFVAAVPITHESRALAQSRVEALQARIADTHIVLREVPADADVLLDGAVVAGRGTERTLDVSPGAHQVLVARDGYLPFQASVDAPAGRTTEVTVRLAERPTVRAHHADTVTRGAWVAGGVLLVAGAVSGGVAYGRAGGTVRGTARAERLQRVGYAADAMMGVGVLMGVVGLVRYLRSDGDVPSDAPAVSVGVGREAISLQVRGAF